MDEGGIEMFLYRDLKIISMDSSKVTSVNRCDAKIPWFVCVVQGIEKIHELI